MASPIDQDRKLAIFIKSLKGGGAERSTVNLANALAERGVDVDLLVIDEKGVFRELVSEKVNFIRLREASFVQTVWRLWRYPIDIVYLLRLILIPGSPKPAAAVPALAVYLRNSRPQALLTALDYANIAAVVARAVAKVDTRVVIGQRNHLSQGHRGRAKWRQKQIAPTLRYFYERHGDLFVLSSKYEGLPGVMVQALACGCPVVSTVCPSGPDEILENGKYGPLVPVADAHALAGATVAQLQTQHDSEYLQSRGRCFSEEAAVQGYLRVLFGK